MNYRILPRRLASITSHFISNNSIRLKWFYSLNIGDYLSPIIVKYISSYTPSYTSFESNKPSLLAIGSILSLAKKDDVVWGSGFIEPEVKLKANPYVVSLRGKLSYDHIKRSYGFVYGQNISFGDPGLLVSDIYTQNHEKKYDIGYIPHFVDLLYFKKKYKNNIKENDIVINVKDGYKKILKTINECNYIASSSLHGLVLADSYSVPNTRIILSNNIIGGDFKFNDYRSGINAPNYKVLDLRRGQEICDQKIKDYSYLTDCSEVKKQLKISIKSYLFENGNHLN